MMMILQHLPVLAYALIGLYFAYLGAWNIYHWGPILEVMAAKNIPHAYFILSLGIAAQIIAGLMLMFQAQSKLVAAILIPFILLAAFMFYPFWHFSGEKRKLNFIIFVTHVTVLIGALLLIIGPIASFGDLLKN